MIIIFLSNVIKFNVNYNLITILEGISMVTLKNTQNSKDLK